MAPIHPTFTKIQHSATTAEQRHRTPSRQFVRGVHRVDAISYGCVWSQLGPLLDQNSDTHQDSIFPCPRHEAAATARIGSVGGKCRPSCSATANGTPIVGRQRLPDAVCAHE